MAIGLATDRDLTTLAAEPLRPRSPHHDDLMGAIDRAFRSAGRTPKELKSVAVSIGPGGYTSLRIAVATAKMLAEATGARVIPVSTHVVAAHASAAIGTFGVALASKNDAASIRVFTRGTQGRLEDGGPARLISTRDLGSLGITTLLADPFLPPSMREEAQSKGIAIELLRLDSTIVLRLSRGLVPIDAAALAPDYAREAEAVTKWRERKVR